ncbi:J domain-containing protein [Roseobacter sinensis]|uniref:J domain-containing protein n=1 Tax=Roseobacter sinensis TaxID=2931391 RepID=A0ABT3BKM4_9RHOB|nr:J domain-containing protein [Roseobacter sp. WL0113]MCV3274125.1 J domain-containing protein [Roseobacter sp. WL0113]
MAATPEHAARVLGLTVDATLEDVRIVRRELALKYHPDRGGDPQRTSRHMARINAAVDTLVAHIKEGQLRRARRQMATEQAFARRRWRVQRAKWAELQAKSRKARRTAESKGAGTDHNGEARPQAPTPDTAQMIRPTKANLALIRLAAASYRSVLDAIGTIDAGPTVDVTALAYPS